jgi:hypothetical protein
MRIVLFESPIFREVDVVEVQMRALSWIILLGFAVLPMAGARAADAPGQAPLVAPAPVSADASAAALAEAAAAVNRELLTTEESVDQTKERVFKSKATLQLLKEIIIEGSANGGRLKILHENKLGGGFNLEAVTYLLDGQSKLSKADSAGSLDQNREFQVSDGTVAPGQHAISVDFKVRPTGYGLFKYAQNYTIDVRSNYAFKVELGKGCTVRATLSEKGGAVDRIEERAHVEYELKCETLDAK